MEIRTFKTMLRENKETLIGRNLTIFLGATNWKETFTTLKDFGSRILELEEEGYTFSFENSLTIVRAKYIDTNYTAPSALELEADIERFGTAA